MNYLSEIEAFRSTLKYDPDSLDMERLRHFLGLVSERLELLNLLSAWRAEEIRIRPSYDEEGSFAGHQVTFVACLEINQVEDLLRLLLADQ